MTWSRKSRHERGYGTDWDKIRPFILARDQYLCQPCLAKGIVHEATEVDHRIPKWKGGTDDEDNLQAINADCHRIKTAEEAAEAKGRAPRVPIGEDGWPLHE